MTVYRMIAVEKAQGFPVSVACELLGVDRSGFWKWETRPPSQRELSDAWLTEKIREIHLANRGVYGARRIHAELRMAHNIHVGKKRVARLMRQAQISGLIPKKRGRTTIRVPGVRVADDLVRRQFRPQAPNVMWFTDITYLRTWEGWLYLAAVQDAFSRRIVGWQMAVERRRPEAGLIHHSDQGSQFVSLGFGQLCARSGIARSMGSTGQCWDNAVAETFFATLKKELVYRRTWPTRPELETEIFEYIEGFYNRQRRHTNLGMLSPANYEAAAQCSDSFTHQKSINNQDSGT